MGPESLGLRRKILSWAKVASSTVERLALSSFQEADGPAFSVLTPCLLGDTGEKTQQSPAGLVHLPHSHPHSESFWWVPPGWTSLAAAGNPREPLSLFPQRPPLSKQLPAVPTVRSPAACGTLSQREVPHKVPGCVPPPRASGPSPKDEGLSPPPVDITISPPSLRPPHTLISRELGDHSPKAPVLARQSSPTLTDPTPSALTGYVTLGKFPNFSELHFLIFNMGVLIVYSQTLLVRIKGINVWKVLYKGLSTSFMLKQGNRSITITIAK